MAASHRLTELESGVRVVTEVVPSVRSVALGMWVGTGSRDEGPEEAGISHFLEHLLFKGTARYSAIEISERFDGLGALVNAATSKETTHLHARFLDDHIERVVDLMAEMFLAPTYPEVDSEREVVLEEIAMYEDEPQDKVHDVLGTAVYGSHPLGRPIIGRAEVISSVPVPEIAAYHASHYVGGNAVVAAAGSVDHEAVVEMTRRHVDAAEGGKPAGDGGGVPEPEPRAVFQEKDTEQFHLCLGGQGIPRGDDRRYALSILDSIFGGSSSSRLFREVREKRGLAYSVGSYSEQYRECGLVAMYAGTRTDHVEEVCEILGRELAALGEGPISEDELERGKEHVKGRLVLSMESTVARMSRLAKAVLFDLPLETLDEMLAKVDAVTQADLASLAGELYTTGSFSAAGIGPDEDRFREALAPVSDGLAVA